MGKIIFKLKVRTTEITASLHGNINVNQKEAYDYLKKICIDLRHLCYKSDMTPALTARYAFCVQYLTSYGHPQ